MILKLKNISFTAIKVLFLMDIDNEKLLVPAKISFDEKNYKDFMVSCIMIINLSHYI